MIRCFRLIGLALAAASLAAPALAASFDCARARGPDERAICADRALNDADVRLAQLFGIVRHFLAMGARGAEIDAQHAWLAERRRCGANRPCLRRLYARREAELTRILERAYTLGPL